MYTFKYENNAPVKLCLDKFSPTFLITTLNTHKSEHFYILTITLLVKVHAHFTH